VASGTGKGGALARDPTRVHFDGFHSDRAPGADCWVDAELFIPAERDAVVRRSLGPPAGNDQIRAEQPACEQSGPDGRDLQPLGPGEPFQRVPDPLRYGSSISCARCRQRDAVIERLVGLLVLLNAGRDAGRCYGSRHGLRADAWERLL
jgi:hypothetical protein